MLLSPGAVTSESGPAGTVVTASPTPTPTPRETLQQALLETLFQKPAPATVPVKPGSLNVTSIPGSLTVGVDWADVPGANSYTVRWREGVRGAQFNDGVSVIRSNAAITVAHSGGWVVRVTACHGPICGPGKSTRFQVQPAPEPTAQPQSSPAAQSPFRPPAQSPFRPTGQPPAMPTGLNVATGNGSLSVSVDWNDVAGALHYTVRWRKDVRGSQFNSGVTVTRSNATISVARHGTWVVKVSACRVLMCGPGKSARFQVKDVDEAPTITGGPTAFSFAERGTAGAECCQEGRLCHPSGRPAPTNPPQAYVATYTATDPQNDTIAWSVEGTDAAGFTIGDDGALSFKASPDFESPGDADSNNTYLLTVKATANGKSDTRAVTVTVTDGNAPPQFVQKKEALQVEEGYAHWLFDFGATDPQGDTMTFSLAGEDSDAFTYEHIHIAGATCYAALNLLHYGREPDYEQPSDADQDGVFSFIVQVSDGTLTTELPVTVTVTDVDEAPVIEGLAAVDFAENSTADVGEYTATDPEGETTTLSLGGWDATSFTFTNGVLRFRSAPDFEAKRTYSLTITASDGTKDATLDVRIHITNVVEPGEITSSGSEILSIAENASVLLLETYTAVDPDGTAITWSVEGADAEAFSIGSDGALSLREAPDYEAPTDADTDNVYRVVVVATSGSKSVRWDIRVTVTGVNEPPVITGPTDVSFAENGSGFVAEYTVEDPENDTIDWSVAGADWHDFGLYDPSPPRAGRQNLDIEVRPDYETKDTYSITLRASDRTHQAELDVTITITNVVEPGE